MLEFKLEMLESALTDFMLDYVLTPPNYLRDANYIRRLIIILVILY